MSQPGVSPGNTEIEQALIGALLMNNHALDHVCDFLEPRHFSEPLHAQIYDLAATMIRSGRVVTPISIARTKMTKRRSI